MGGCGRGCGREAFPTRLSKGDIVTDNDITPSHLLLTSLIAGAARAGACGRLNKGGYEVLGQL